MEYRLLYSPGLNEPRSSPCATEARPRSHHPYNICVRGRCVCIQTLTDTSGPPVTRSEIHICSSCWWCLTSVRPPHQDNINAPYSANKHSHPDAHPQGGTLTMLWVHLRSTQGFRWTKLPQSKLSISILCVASLKPNVMESLMYRFHKSRDVICNPSLLNCLPPLQTWLISLRAVPKELWTTLT